MELERPPAAVGILVAICKSMNRDVKVFDFNLRLYNDLNAEEFQQTEKYWRLRVQLPPALKEKIDKKFQDYVKEVLEYQPDLLALSVFTLMNNKASHNFLSVWKTLGKNKICVVAGGQGLSTPYKVNLSQQETRLQSNADLNFAQFLQQNKLINHYVIGDGEDAFINILNNNFNFPGIDGISPVQLENLDSYPIPDYSCTDPNSYKYTQDPGVYITATRGCVRQCVFCDVPMRWPKFKYRSGKNVALEIFSHWQKHGVRIFQLTDSVVNGNLNEFLAMNQELLRYKKEFPDMDIKLLGQFNIRDKKQMTEEQYRTMAAAGWNVLIPGVESGSERVRFHMGKDFTNKDLDWHFYQCAKWGMQNVCLMFVGYPDEKIEDHQENINFLYKYEKYMHSGTILMIRWGYTGSIDIGSKLSVKDLNFNIVPQNPDLDLTHLTEHDQYWVYGRNWVNLNNLSLTFEERIRRRLEVHETSVRLGWPVTRPKEELEIIKKIVLEFKGIKQSSSDDLIFADVGDH